MTEAMSAGAAPGADDSGQDEWCDGWRIVLACALASGTGISLLFFTFSLFLLPIAAEFHATRGELGVIQALVITAALGSPIFGRMADRLGFRLVYFLCTGVVAIAALLLSGLVTNTVELGIAIAVIGFFGVGSTAVVVTRPVSAHFRRHRGKALGLVAVGVSITTMLAPPPLQWVLDNYGWRGGFVALTLIAIGIGVPAVALVLPRTAGQPTLVARSAGGSGGDTAFLRERDFWLMAFSNMAMNLAAAGTVSQLSPMIQEEGIGAKTAALALSFFAAGQFVGRLGGGWLLDRFEPRRVAFTLTLVPATGFLMLFLSTGMPALALFAAAMIGLQQGAELDIFAYFTARRFDVARYGTIYGSLHGLGWIGNAVGIIGIGLLHDHFHSYAPAQIAALLSLLLGALLILRVRLPDRA